MDPIAEIKPNVKKAYAFTAAKVFGVAGLIIGFLFYLNRIVGLAIFSELLSDAGYSLSASQALTWFGAAVVAISLLLMFACHVRLSQIRYVFYADMLVTYTSAYMVQINETKVPYANVARVTADSGGIANSLLKTGSVNIETSGMQTGIVLQYVDNAEQVAADVLTLINKYKTNMAAQELEQKRFRQIIDRE
ncbi:MAG: hypothetical protein ABH879_06865 [archaeon]